MLDEDIDRIADRAAQKAIDRIDINRIAEDAAKRALDIVYIEIGKSVIRKMAWATGIVLVGLFAYFSAKGFIK